MKVFMGVLFLVLAAPSLAQAPSQDSILIGDFGDVRLSLGQPKDFALRALREHFDVGVEDSETGKVAIFSKGSLSPEAKAGVHYGWVSFHNGRLSSVIKLWDVNGPDRGVAVVRAIHGAIQSFGTSGRTCNVKSFEHQEPSMEKSGVVISCGQRQVQIFTNRWASSTGSGEGVVVTEVLGSEP